MEKSSLEAHKGSGLKKGRWTVQEDQKLIRYMEGLIQLFCGAFCLA